MTPILKNILLKAELFIVLIICCALISGCNSNKIVNTHAIENKCDSILPSLLYDQNGKDGYVSKVTTIVIASTTFGKKRLTPVAATIAIPIVQNSKGERYFIMPGVKSLFDNCFEKYFYNDMKLSRDNNKWAVIVKNLRINLTKGLIHFEIIGRAIEKDDEPFRYKATIKMVIVDEAKIPDYQLLTHDLNQLYQYIVSLLEEDVNLMLERKFHQYLIKG